MAFTLPLDPGALYQQVPDWVWTPALNADNQRREGADLADFTGLLTLDGWPTGMRVIVHRERPYPGAQLRFDDVDGYRLIAFATNTTLGTLRQLELRHRRRARCEDRIRIAKDTGLARRWEPKRLRYRLYTIPATLARRARRVVLHRT